MRLLMVLWALGLPGLGLAAEPTAAEPATAPAAGPVAPADLRPKLDVPAADVDLPKADVPDFATEELSLGWTLFRTAIVLGLVIAIIYLTLNVGLRKLLGIQAPSRGAPVVAVLERVALDQKRSLYVVQAANEVLLVGGTDGGLALISKLDAAEVGRLRAEQKPSVAVQMSPFLKKLLGRGEAPPKA